MKVRATFNGEPIDASAGASIGAALVAAGHTTWRTTRSGKRRGLFCGIGVCYDCLITVDGRTVRACMAPLEQGMALTDHDTGGEDSDD